MSDVRVGLHIVFRPYMTDEFYPGYEGQPWDWDGTIPGWVWELMDTLDQILEFVNTVYPTPDAMAAAEALDTVQEILQFYEDIGGSSLFSASIPPDPNLYPYVIDGEGQLYSIGDDDSYDWTDAYDIDLTLGRYDLRGLVALLVDMEDLDLSSHDNMGDYLDHDGTPLVLSTDWIRDNAYCTSTYYNPTNEPQESEHAFLPSSILYLAVEIE